MRPILSRLVAIALIVVAGLFLSGCGQKKATLHLYNWADYMDPDLVTAFEEQYDCRIILDTFDSNESMLAKLEAGASGYDIAFPTAYMVDIMQTKEMLMAIDHSKIPNLKNVDADYLKNNALDKTMAYSVPYMIGSTGIAYRTDRVTDFTPSWAMFDRADLKGRSTLLNDIRETLGSALIYLGYSANTTNPNELSEAATVVNRWKANIAKFDAEAYKPGIASGEFVLVHGYSGDILQVMEEQENVAWAYPQEGFLIGCDNFVILKDAPNADLAHAFINFLHDASNAAKNTEFVYYLCPNSASYPLVSEEVRSNEAVFIPKEAMAKAQILKDLGPVSELWEKIWDEIKSGR